MLAGKLDAVINALRQFNAPAIVRFLEKNRHRMDYPSYREQGFSIGTGRIESACKNVVGGRLKCGGMRWGMLGVQFLLALRCRIENGELNDWYEQQRHALKVVANGVYALA